MSPAPVATVTFDAYSILGVDKAASDEEIRQAYHALARKHHPDKAKRADVVEATERFQQIQAAYEAVNPVNRRFYDVGFQGFKTGKTELMEACENADSARVYRLLESFADPCEKDSTGRVALMFAAGAADLESMRLLLQHGADVEARNCAGHSCVMFGVGTALVVDSPEKVNRALRHLEAVKILLDEGAPVDGATCYGLTALMLACTSGRYNMIELLASRGADVNAKSDIGLSALIMAADKGHGDAVRLILRYHADPNEAYAARRTPLMGAAAQAHTDVVETLIAHRADVNATSDDGHSALLFAVAKGLKDGLVCPISGAEVEKPGLVGTVDALLQARADPNLKGPGGRTPLHLACAGGSTDIVMRLRTVGAELDRLDDEGRTPAHIANSLGLTDVLEALRSSGQCARSGAACPFAEQQSFMYSLASCSCFSFLQS